MQGKLFTCKTMYLDDTGVSPDTARRFRGGSSFKSSDNPCFLLDVRIVLLGVVV